MPQITISLDPASAEYDRLKQEITQYLDTLETVEYTSEKRRAEAGTLAQVDAQTVLIIANVSAAVLNFITAIINISRQIHASSQPGETDPTRRVTSKATFIEIQGLTLPLPPSDNAAKIFLKSVESLLAGTQPNKHKLPPRRSTRSRTKRKTTTSKGKKARKPSR